MKGVIAVFFILISVVFTSCGSQKNPDATKFADATKPAAVIERDDKSQRNYEPKELQIFKQAYPDVTFVTVYDTQNNDWIVTISSGEKKTDLYFADGKFLPKEELGEAKKYSSILRNYPRQIPNPADYSQEYIQELRNYIADESTKKNYDFPQFFYMAIYDCDLQTAPKKHIVSLNFLGKRVNVHEKVKASLAKVEKRIYEAAKTDADVKSFVDTISKIYGYNWRFTRSSSMLSYHSMGAAIDILPKGFERKNIYWAWRRKADPQNWMFLPLEQRWMPPAAVIDIFEEEGFIWGGKWTVWDNMHFEYHPELMLYRKMQIF